MLCSAQRAPDKRAPAVVSLAFTGLAVAPLVFVVLYVLGGIGANFKVGICMALIHTSACSSAAPMPTPDCCRHDAAGRLLFILLHIRHLHEVSCASSYVMMFIDQPCGACLFLLLVRWMLLCPLSRTLLTALQGFPIDGTTRLAAMIFHGSIGSMLFLYYLFWVKLNLAQTLPLVLAIGAVVALSGYKTLSGLASARLKKD